MHRLIIPLLIWPASILADVPVSVERLEALTLRPSQSAPASVIARNMPALASEIDARIEAIPVRVGDIVEAGTVVAKLDCRIYQSRLAAAEARKEQLEVQHAFADSQLRRALELQAKRGISEETVEQRQSDLAALAAQLKAQHEAQAQARLQVERCNIVAPVDAVVTDRLAHRGSLANPGTQLVQLVQLDELEVSAALRTDEIRQFDGATETVFFHAGQAYPLTLRTVLPVVSEMTRTREARFIFTDAKAPPGAAGRLQWEGSTPVLPPHYFVRRGDELGIFIANDGAARFHAVADALEGQPESVDLPGDTLVVVEGRQRLSDGDPLTIRADPASAAP